MGSKTINLRQRVSRVSLALVLAAQMLFPVSAGAMRIMPPNGNNGTLKVHEFDTPSGNKNNDPKVCKFNFEGFGFDPAQDGYIVINGQGQSNGTDYGPFTAGPANQSGYFQTLPYYNGFGQAIADGHYKATMYGKDTGGDIDLTNEKAKSKVFKVECAEPEVGSVKVHKATDADGDDKYISSDVLGNSFGFRWGLDGENPVRLMGSTAQNVPAGNSTVTENNVNGYKLTGWYYTGEKIGRFDRSCEWNPRALPVAVEVKKDQKTEITLCNQVKKGSITIVKDAQPNDEENFGFTIDKKFSQWDKQFYLDDDGNNYNQLSNQKTFDDLDHGFYTVSEWYQPGWKLKDISCSEGAEAHVDKDNRKVVIKLGKGEDVTCTFVNKKPQAKLTIQKESEPNSKQDFDFNLRPKYGNWDKDFVLDDDNGADDINDDHKHFELTPGKYVVTEEEASGWDLKSIKCSYDGGKTYVTGGEYIYTDVNDHKLVVELKDEDDLLCKFANHKDSNVGGVKFEDKNGNGKQDDGEEGLEGWTINLYDTDKRFTALNLPTPVKSEETDEDGEYEFTDLDKGSYKVCEVQQDGWTQTYPTTDDGCHEFEITGPGQDVVADFGNQRVPEDGEDNGEDEDEGHVLGEVTKPQPPVAALVNTGTSAIQNLAVALIVIALVGALTQATRRTQYQS